MRLNLALLLIIGSMFASARAARACGGGVVASTQAGTIGADAQRIFISVRGAMTDIVTQIGVPRTTADYGVLIPVPSAPTLDANPVASADIDKLFARTAPTIVVQASGDDGGSGCGCGSVKGGSNPSGAAQVSQPVTIGPVTAVTLTADTGAAVNIWLADNGFTLSASSQSIVSSYAGTGRYFIAIRRSDTAASGGPTSVGVHFTLAGDERGLPLKFAGIGAANAVGFTILVAADEVVGPSAPFEALTLTDLDANILRSTGYYSAIASRIANQGGRAFLIEGSWTGAELADGDWPSLQPFIDAGQQLTRLSTVIRSLDLDTDVVLNQPFAGTAPRERIVQRTRGPEDSPKLALGLAVLAFAAVGARRRPER
jgi:MYXO-CTERM domain-containing protein